MANTNSLSWPNMFDVARNTTSVATDAQSIVNRVKLLMLTEPTELYNNLEFGLGLRRHLWQYNTDNQIAIIKDRLVEQLKLHEPCVDAEKTQIVKGLLFTGTDASVNQQYNSLNVTVSVVTIFGDTLEVNV